MILKHGIHLAYCTNVHRGETWAETFTALENHTLRVKERVQPNGRYAIGLRLSDLVSRELSDPQTLLQFRTLARSARLLRFYNQRISRQFHGTRVKENVYRPDWTDRVGWNTPTADCCATVPLGIEGSVSTLPGSFKDFVVTGTRARHSQQFWSCVEHVASLVNGRTGNFTSGSSPSRSAGSKTRRPGLLRAMRDEHRTTPA
jgi:hypothetical protein